MTMFNQTGFQPPESSRTEEFLLRPIRATDAELDYAAVMETWEFLRSWEQSTWPADDFTLEANRENLARHELDHGNGEPFTYTVLNPEENLCLGCVCIFPTCAPMYSRAQISPVNDDRWTAFDAAVYFWVR